MRRVEIHRLGRVDRRATTDTDHGIKRVAACEVDGLQPGLFGGLDANAVIHHPLHAVGVQ